MRHRWSGRVATAGAVGFLLVACSSDDDGMTAREFARRYCELWNPCCVAAGLPTEHDFCEAMFSRIRLKDPAAAEQCLADLEAMPRDADWCFASNDRPTPPSCGKALPEGDDGGTGGGRKQPGEACEFSSECASSSKGPVNCYHDFATDKEYCRVFRIVGIGESCYGDVRGEAWSLVNAPSGTPEVAVCDLAADHKCEDGKCRALAQPGEACTGSSSCVAAAYCSAGTCKPRVPAGESCADSTDACVATAYCASPTNVCQPRLPVGESCSANAQCLSHSCDVTCKPDFATELALAFFCN